MHWKNFASSFKKQKGTEKPLFPPREEVAPSLPGIQFRKLKVPEFSRTATYWKNFTSSFKKQKALKNLCHPHAKRFQAPSLPSTPFRKL
jgi:hypothetical protein